MDDISNSKAIRGWSKWPMVFNLDRKLLANLGEVCPVSANQRKTMADSFVLDSWKRSWRENYAWREYFPTPNLERHHESDRMVAFQSTAIGVH